MVKIKNKKAQAAVELAVFGAVLIYIIGSIVRTAVSNSYTQDYNFQVMRLALLTAWQNGQSGYNPNLSHANTSIVYVQDRLSPDSGKYGDLDRDPFIAQGSGTFSFNLDYPLSSESDIKDNLPIMDVFINGMHFAFTTAAYGTYSLKKSSSCGGGGPYSPPQNQMQCLQNQCLRNQREWSGGNKLFYIQIPNGTPKGAIPSFSSSGPCNHDMTKDTDGWLCGDNPFDLGRNGQATVPGALRSDIAWEWGATPAASTTMIGLDTANGMFPSYDVDGRLKTVTIIKFTPGSSVSFEDFQGGDIDSTWDLTSCGPKPGLLSDTMIYTFTSNTGNGPSQGPTYLQIKEGKLYNPANGQVVRSLSSHDSVDVVQREIQLSNNNGEFCGGGNANGVPNPVEVCSNNCFSSDTITKTCLDTNDNIIFVRTRLQNISGHAWLTNIAGQLQVHQ